MNDINQIKKNIKEELEKVKPGKKTILTYLFKLRAYLSDAEFFDVVGEAFKTNPEFYMKLLYKKVRKRMRKLHGVVKLKEMEKYILEKFCFYDDEQILFEYEGKIFCWNHPKLLSYGIYIYGTMYVSNYRIFALGEIIPLGNRIPPLDTQKQIKNFSLQQECYGYVFPIQNLSILKKKRNGVSFHVELSNHTVDVKIIFKSFKQEEDKNKFFEFLSTYVKEI